MKVDFWISNESNAVISMLQEREYCTNQGQMNSLFLKLFKGLFVTMNNPVYILE